MIHLKRIIALLFIVLGLSACKDNPLIVDTSNSQVEISFLNVDNAIFHSDSAELIKKHSEFKNEISDVYSYEIGFVLEIGNVDDTTFYNSIQKFRSDTSIQTLENRIAQIYPKLKEREEIIEEGFSHLKYHFPDDVRPKSIVYLNSLYRNGVFSTENEIGVGMEWFMGDTTDVIKRLNPEYFFDWMKSAMNIKYYERDVLTSWIETHYVDYSKGNLAENMVRWGKILYLVEASFPEFESNIILRYESEDYDWAVDNELFFWRHLVDEKLLFKSDERTTRNMMNEGPFTPGLPNQDAPDRLGQFLGWRMVHRYMEKNEVTLSEMVDVSYNEILQDYDID